MSKKDTSARFLRCTASVCNTHDCGSTKVLAPRFPHPACRSQGCRAPVPTKNGPIDASNKRRPIAQMKCPEHGGVVFFSRKDVLHVFLGGRVFCTTRGLAAAQVAEPRRTSRFLHLRAATFIELGPSPRTSAKLVSTTVLRRFSHVALHKTFPPCA